MIGRLEQRSDLEMHIAVIGAGPAGLCSARHITTMDSNMACTVYEQTNVLGGTWFYTDATGIDEKGLPVHTSMYKSLKTNLPKENMEFPGFPLKHKKSYLPGEEIHKYFVHYADHYHLTKHIKFHHKVCNVKPNNNGWEVTVINLLTNVENTINFDAVMVCNGHYSHPYIPHIPGLECFLGDIVHSYHYRVPEPFREKSVLVIGGGASGIDIVLDLAPVTSQLYFSYQRLQAATEKFPDNIRHKPIVTRVTSSAVEFEDGSMCQIDIIVICTGYKYNFPFLSSECGITVKDNFVQPLFKHLINIHHPTMCFIGLPFINFNYPLFDCQVQLFLRTLSGVIKLPDASSMLADTDEDIKQRQADGLQCKHYHMLGRRLKPYIDSITELGQLQPLPPVMFKIYYRCEEERKNNVTEFRKNVFHIVDNDRYELNSDH